MESGTCIFRVWLESLAYAVAGRDLRVALDVVATQAEQAFGTRVWFAKILGRRWSYIAGLKSEQPTWSETHKAPLAAGIGLVAEGWGELSLQEQERLKAFLARLVVSKQSLEKWG
jgi:hypothetical protein